MNDELRSLIERFQDGECSPDETAILEERLRTEPSARAAFVEQCLLEMQLYKALALEQAATIREGRDTAPPPGRPAPARRPGLSRDRVLWVAGLAASILLLAGVWWWSPAGRPTATDVRPTIARVESAGGDLLVADHDGEPRPAAAGEPILVGQTVRTQGEESWATLVLPDATRIDLGPESVVQFPAAAGAESGRVHLERGAIQVAASKQPRENPLVFTTAHARVLVLGTRFRLYEEASASRVELEEGKVRLIRTVDGRAVEVPERTAAVATDGPQPLEPSPLSAATARLRHSFPQAGPAVAFSPDGTRLASNRADQWKLWDVADGRLLRSSSRHRDGRFGLAFAGGDILLGLSQRQTLTVWDTREWGERQWPLVGDEPSRDGAPSGDGRWVAVGQVERKMTVWAVEEDGPRKRFAFQTRDNPNRVTLSRELPVGAPRLAYGLWNGGIEILDLIADPPAPVRQFKLTRTPVALALRDDGRGLASYSLPDGLQLWDVATGEKRDVWSSQAARIECLRFSPDGQFLAAGLTDGTARVWSTADGRSLLVLEAGGRTVRGVAFSPDGTLLATAADNGQVNVWECSFAAAAER